MSKNNLYVKNFVNLDDEDLKILFSGYGKITSVKVPKNDSGLCKGYGFVCFETEKQAETALREMNGYMMGTKQLYVSYHEPKELRKNKQLYVDKLPFQKSEIHKSSSYKIIVKNLSEKVDDAILHYLFKRFGNIISSEVKKSRNGLSMGCGLVCFSTEYEANSAIRVMNGYMLHSKKLYVASMESNTTRMETEQFNFKYKYGSQMNLASELQISPQDLLKLHKYSSQMNLASELQKSPQVKLFVGNLDEELDSSTLHSLFTRYGTITCCNILEKNGKSKGCGFVSFSTEEEALNAIRSMNGFKYHSKQLLVDFYKNKVEKKNESSIASFNNKLKFHASTSSLNKPENRQNNLHIGNLDEDTDDDGLKRLFERFGKIISAKVMTNNWGKSKGYGYVCFETEEEANLAIRVMNGMKLPKNTITVAHEQKRKACTPVASHQETTEKECCICYEHLTTRIVFDPCGHTCVCENCATRIKECPICRSEFVKYLKIFM